MRTAGWLGRAWNVIGRGSDVYGRLSFISFVLGGLLLILKVLAGIYGVAGTILLIVGICSILLGEISRRAARNTPKRDPVAATVGIEIGDEQKRVLEFVAEVFDRDAVWPTFQYADKMLARQGIEVQPVLRSMPRGLVFPDVNWGGWHYRSDDELRLSIDGLTRCRRAAGHVEFFVSALRYLAEREWEHVPSGPAEVSELQVTSTEVRDAIGGSERDLQRLLLLIRVEGGFYSSISGSGTDWSLSPSREIRRFRGITDANEYLTAKGTST